MAGRVGFAIGLACGAAIWLLSPVLTRHSEPWDGPVSVYAGSLLAAGMIGGWVVPDRWGWVAPGVFAGQALVLLGRVVADPGDGGLWPLGLAFLAVYSMLSVAGAAGAAIARGRVRSRGRGAR